ncbi:uncharacterized protein PgNI_02945 [Pyricularia grisea]|uniref:Uncharacterized protein n=1 Tax=Pyricularia grisea TaxID=148305 RepID=A0A6P8B9Z4_PYRGI|nr:uncharacterized protein PgNI_02945 [Pyricularia grisea]TLD12639.1 hypothetical protein PgNI_02945 [Pyricularia grisea]
MAGACVSQYSGLRNLFDDLWGITRGYRLSIRLTLQDWYVLHHKHTKWKPLEDEGMRQGPNWISAARATGR